MKRNNLYHNVFPTKRLNTCAQLCQNVDKSRSGENLRVMETKGDFLPTSRAGLGAELWFQSKACGLATSCLCEAQLRLKIEPGLFPGETHNAENGSGWDADPLRHLSFFRLVLTVSRSS